MVECEVKDVCPFFFNKLPHFPELTSIYKKKYCLQDKASCARYIIREKLGKNKVPMDLFPNQIEKAHKLIESS